MLALKYNISVKHRIGQHQRAGTQAASPKDKTGVGRAAPPPHSTGAGHGGGAAAQAAPAPRHLLPAQLLEQEERARFPLKSTPAPLWGWRPQQIVGGAAPPGCSGAGEPSLPPAQDVLPSPGSGSLVMMGAARTNPCIWCH